jgi:hypothetical protein
MAERRLSSLLGFDDSSLPSLMCPWHFIWVRAMALTGMENAEHDADNAATIAMRRACFIMVSNDRHLLPTCTEQRGEEWMGDVN